jgi:hypothetical protein
MRGEKTGTQAQHSIAPLSLLKLISAAAGIRLVLSPSGDAGKHGPDWLQNPIPTPKNSPVTTFFRFLCGD